MPASYASPLWDALEHGDDARAQEILQAFIQNEYINEGGTHGDDDVELAALDYMDFTIEQHQPPRYQAALVWSGSRITLP